MKTLSIAIDTTSLNNIRSEQTYEEFKSRHLGWRSPPCSSRSSEYGAYGKRLLVHQKGVSV
jgi:hypothetical protein